MNKFFVLLFIFYTSMGFSAELPDTIDKIRGSIVSVGILRPLKSLNPKGPRHEYRGTGFVVGNGQQIVTNYHVLPEKLADEPNAVLAVFVGNGDKVRAFPARVAKTDEEHDLALLDISGIRLPAMRLSLTKPVREGQTVVFTGFPIGLVLGMYPVTSKSIVSAITPIVIPAVSSRTLTAAQIRLMKSAFDVFQLDAIAYPGNSGSPVYDPATGDVIAVVNSVFVKGTKEAVLKNPSAIAYAIPVKYVAELLNE